MAVYKLFPSQDTTLYSAYPAMNTGLDAILEVSNKLAFDGSPEVARYLVQFDQTEIQDIFNSKVSGSQYKVYLKNFIAEAQGLNQDTSLEILPIAQNWNNGTGYYLDNPKEMDGASWGYSNYSGSNPWDFTGFYSGSAGCIYYTGSYNTLYSGAGGGNWFYNNSGSLYVVVNYVVPNYIANPAPYSGATSSTFELRNVKDIEVNVSTIVNTWLTGSIPNNGFLVKLTGSQEFNTSQYVQPVFKYYSVDTNTIYPPCLEFRWRDYKTVLTGSATGSIVSTSNIKMSLAENPGVFFPESVNRFYVNVSPLYPTRTYQTSSMFTDLNYLPTASYYAIKDLDTNEYVVNFDDNYTQISSDSNGNYFDVYMSGLEPERYYKILIKSHIQGSTIIYDDHYYFKVING
jgi:hypothetical protein